jgi:hypothetical protein
MSTPALPSSIKALRASLRTAAEPGLRDRLQNALARVERLYGLRKPVKQDMGDMRRRRFVGETHRLPVHSRGIGKH